PRRARPDGRPGPGRPPGPCGGGACASRAPRGSRCGYSPGPGLDLREGLCTRPPGGRAGPPSTAPASTGSTVGARWHSRWDGTHGVSSGPASASTPHVRELLGPERFGAPETVGPAPPPAPAAAAAEVGVAGVVAALRPAPGGSTLRPAAGGAARGRAAGGEVAHDDLSGRGVRGAGAGGVGGVLVGPRRRPAASPLHRG